jgi:hypothetical protein
MVCSYVIDLRSNSLYNLARSLVLILLSLLIITTHHHNNIFSFSHFPLSDLLCGFSFSSGFLGFISSYTPSIYISAFLCDFHIISLWFQVGYLSSSGFNSSSNASLSSLSTTCSTKHTIYLSNQVYHTANMFSSKTIIILAIATGMIQVGTNAAAIPRNAEVIGRRALDSAIGKHIQTARDEQGLSVEALATAVDIAESELVAIESGEASVDSSVLDRIDRRLNIEDRATTKGTKGTKGPKGTKTNKTNGANKVKTAMKGKDVKQVEKQTGIPSTTLEKLQKGESILNIALTAAELTKLVATLPGLQLTPDEQAALEDSNPTKRDIDIEVRATTKGTKGTKGPKGTKTNKTNGANKVKTAMKGKDVKQVEKQTGIPSTTLEKLQKGESILNIALTAAELSKLVATLPGLQLTPDEQAALEDSNPTKRDIDVEARATTKGTKGTKGPKGTKTNKTNGANKVKTAMKGKDVKQVEKQTGIPSTTLEKLQKGESILNIALTAAELTKLVATLPGLQLTPDEQAALEDPNPTKRDIDVEARATTKGTKGTKGPKGSKTNKTNGANKVKTAMKGKDVKQVEKQTGIPSTTLEKLQKGESILNIALTAAELTKLVATLPGLQLTPDEQAALEDPNPTKRDIDTRATTKGTKGTKGPKGTKTNKTNGANKVKTAMKGKDVKQVEKQTGIPSTTLEKLQKGESILNIALTAAELTKLVATLPGLQLTPDEQAALEDSNPTKRDIDVEARATTKGTKGTKGPKGTKTNKTNGANKVKTAMKGKDVKQVEKQTGIPSTTLEKLQKGESILNIALTAAELTKLVATLPGLQLTPDEQAALEDPNPTKRSVVDIDAIVADIWARASLADTDIDY